MRRSPARFLAPIALAAVVFALYSVVQDGRDKSAGNSGGQATATATATSTTKKKSSSSKKKAKTYTVKSGDTLSGIAEKTGVSLGTLNRLNPNADTLAPGQKLRMSK